MPDQPKIDRPGLAEDFLMGSRISDAVAFLNAALMDAYQSGYVVEIHQQVITMNGRHPRGCPVLVPIVLRQITPSNLSGR